MKLEEKLVTLRKEKGISQLQVAEELDVSRQAISRWEVGASLPSTDNLRGLAALYGIPVDTLLNEEVELTHAQERSSGTLQQSLRMETTQELPSKKSRGEKRLQSFAALILALSLFWLGYLTGYIRASKECEDNKAIPISSLDEMPWDSEGADEFPIVWPIE